MIAGVFFVLSAVALFASRRRTRAPLFPLFEETGRLSRGGIPSHVVTARGVDVPLDSLNGLDLLEFTRCLSEIGRLPETADPTEALAW